MTNEECVKNSYQVTIIASSAGQQLNTDTWDDELNADSRLDADSANSSIRTTTPAKSSAIKTSPHLPSSSRMQSLSLQTSISASSELHWNFLCSQSSCGNRSWEGTFAILLQRDCEWACHSHWTFDQHVSLWSSLLFQFLLQPTMPDIQMFHSSDTSFVTIRRSPIPQNSKLHYISLASSKTSLLLMISLSPLLSACCPVVLLWVCCRQPPNIKIIASPVSIEKSLNDVRLACLRHERCQISRPLDVPIASMTFCWDSWASCTLQIWSTLRHVEDRAHSWSVQLRMLTGITVSRLCLFLELGTRRWTTVLHLHHHQHRGLVLVQFLRPHSFLVNDSQSSHTLKRISHSDDGWEFQNDCTFEVCKHLHHPLSRSCHVPVLDMQVQSSFNITWENFVGDFRLCLKDPGQSCDNSVSMKWSCQALAPLRLPSLTFKHCHNTCCPTTALCSSGASMKNQICFRSLTTCSHCIKTHDTVTPLDCQQIDQRSVVNIRRSREHWWILQTLSHSIWIFLCAHHLFPDRFSLLSWSHLHGSNLSQLQFPTDVWCVQHDSLQSSPRSLSKVSALHWHCWHEDTTISFVLEHSKSLSSTMPSICSFCAARSCSSANWSVSVSPDSLMGTAGSTLKSWTWERWILNTTFDLSHKIWLNSKVSCQSSHWSSSDCSMWSGHHMTITLIESSNPDSFHPLHIKFPPQTRRINRHSYHAR